MVKVLLISNKDDITTDFIVRQLINRNVNFYRFNTEELSKSVHVSLDFVNDKFVIYDFLQEREINLEKIESVYYRRPELPNIEIEDITKGELLFLQNEFLYTLEGIYKILRGAKWLNPLYSIREAENKIYQLSLAKEIGFSIPNTLISNNSDKSDLFFKSNKKNCIIKPIKSGIVGDISSSKVIFTTKLPKNTNFQKVEIAPIYLQNNVHKNSDIRLTIIGDKFFAAKILSQSTNLTKIDWRKTEHKLEYSKIELSNDIKIKCISLMKKLNLNFGAIDLIETNENELVFLEINPNGQWAWIEQELGYDISGAIVNNLIQ